MPPPQQEFQTIHNFARLRLHDLVRCFGAAVGQRKHVSMNPKASMNSLANNTDQWTEDPNKQRCPDSTGGKSNPPVHVGTQVLFMSLGLKRVILPTLSD